MADGLHMGKLSLSDSQHAAPPAQNGAPVGRAAYIPPHLRQRNPGAIMDDAAPPPGPGYGGNPRYATFFLYFYSRSSANPKLIF